MKKLLSKTYTSEASEVVYSSSKDSPKKLKSPKTENVDANDKLANGHGGNTNATKKDGMPEHCKKFVRLKNWISDKQITDTLHQQSMRVCYKHDTIYTIQWSETSL